MIPTNKTLLQEILDEQKRLSMKDRLKSWLTAINKSLLRIVGTRPNDR